MTGGSTAPAPPVPDPLREVPPADRFCDLVLNGGVASGVVYPWAMLELARRYRFRSIGGNSVGAMAAAMAAAAEYGRCIGVEDAFEPLRRFPLDLAEEKDGSPLMLRLFQASPALDRLFKVFLLVVRGSEGSQNMVAKACPSGPSWWVLLKLYGFWQSLALIGLPIVLAAVVGKWLRAPWSLDLVLVIFIGWVVLLVAGVCTRLSADLRALADNDYGLCRGKSQMPGQEALVEWLHRGIQCSVGRGEQDPPLTFADLWAAPRFGQAGPLPLEGGLQPDEPGINLQMFSSNVALGRPIRLPLNDLNTRLYYCPAEWKEIFPERVMAALEHASSPYAPASSSDPGTDTKVRIGPRTGSAATTIAVTELRELPSGGMPLVVAARLSLCFPILFTCVPVYAVDYEADRGERTLRRCLTSDGGLCCNFPVHLFDAAHPRWPTFAMLLDERARIGRFKNQAVWLPKTNLEGRTDGWQRDVPGAELDQNATPKSPAARLGNVLMGMLSTAKDWNDQLTARLPTVRNRVVRLALRKGEGQLNIAMPGALMLRMANEYGVESARQLIEQFAPTEAVPVTRGWRDHLYLRAIVELRALREHLNRYGQSVRSRGDMIPLRELLHEVTAAHLLTLDERLGDSAITRPLAKAADRVDAGGDPLSPEERDALLRAIDAVEALEHRLTAFDDSQFGPYVPILAPEMRLRAPI